MTDQPDTTAAPPDPPQRDGDDDEALERSATSIREAQVAEDSVAASDDITTRDDERAGEHSEDPDGEGGHP